MMLQDLTSNVGETTKVRVDLYRDLGEMAEQAKGTTLEKPVYVIVLEITFRAPHTAIPEMPDDTYYIVRISNLEMTSLKQFC